MKTPQHAGDIAQAIAFAAYDKRVEVLENALKTTLGILAGKLLTEEEARQAGKATDVLNAKES